MTTARILPILAAMAAATALVAAPASARSAPHADLAVTRVAGLPHGTLAAGASLRLATTVKNRGRRASAASKLALYVSADRRLDRLDTRAGRVGVPRLRGARRRTVRPRLTIRAPAAGGAWFLLACADATRVVRESNERNNCRASARMAAVSGPAASGRGNAPAPDGPGPVTVPDDVQPQLPVRGAF